MADKKRVTVPVRVHPGTRDDWHDYAEDTDEWDSVSDLIRGAVAREMDGWYSPPGQMPADGSVQANVDLDPVLNRLDNISSDIQSLTDRVDSIERESEDMMTLLGEDIRETIPTVDDPDDIKSVEADPRKGGKWLAEEAGYIDEVVGTVTARRGVREAKVLNAVDKLKQDLPASIKEVTVAEGDHRLVEVR